MGNLLHFRKKPSITITQENLASLDQLEDHRLLSLHARTQGLSYREYRTLMGMYNISLETAIENARNGITILDYVKARERRVRTFRRASRLIATIGSLAVALLIYTAAPKTDRNSVCQEYLDTVVQRDTNETTRGQTEYYCLLAQQSDPENNAYKRVLESRRITNGKGFLESYLETFGFSN